MTELERRAQAWIEAVHPHAVHLTRARDWVVRLDPDASDAVRIAAVLHDVERAFPDPDCPYDPADDFADPGYLRWHQERCARMAGEWLEEQGAPDALRAEVQRLVDVHEEGGWPEADLLQAADSLSFLEVLGAVPVRWVRSGKPLSVAEDKLQLMADRIRVDAARGPAAELLEDRLAEVRAADAEERTA